MKQDITKNFLLQVTNSDAKKQNRKPDILIFPVLQICSPLTANNSSDIINLQIVKKREKEKQQYAKRKLVFLFSALGFHHSIPTGISHKYKKSLTSFLDFGSIRDPSLTKNMQNSHIKIYELNLQVPQFGVQHNHRQLQNNYI